MGFYTTIEAIKQRCKKYKPRKFLPNLLTDKILTFYSKISTFFFIIIFKFILILKWQ